MNILFTLCGRAGSKGFKNKNLKSFLECPLVYYSIAAISLYNELYKDDKVYVALSTDSEDLMNIVKKQNDVEVYAINRDINLAGDLVPKVAVIQDCLSKSEKYYHTNFDIVVDLDITSPLRTVDDIRKAIVKKIDFCETDVVYSVTESRRNPYFNMVKENNGFFMKALQSDYTARQQAPLFYDMNASIYVYSVEALKNKSMNTFFNDRCSAIIMYDTGILDIDSEEDFKLMQVIAKYLFEQNLQYGMIADRAKHML